MQRSCQSWGLRIETVVILAREVKLPEKLGDFVAVKHAAGCT
ncbi:hypothetical protein [Roseimicrobium sp. ORNL1]|nr:hypothetical protein [Roseimicrobium sp. ORNL1]